MIKGIIFTFLTIFKIIEFYIFKAINAFLQKEFLKH